MRNKVRLDDSIMTVRPGGALPQLPLGDGPKALPPVIEIFRPNALPPGGAVPQPPPGDEPEAHPGILLPALGPGDEARNAAMTSDTLIAADVQDVGAGSGGRAGPLVPLEDPAGMGAEPGPLGPDEFGLEMLQQPPSAAGGPVSGDQNFRRAEIRGPRSRSSCPRDTRGRSDMCTALLDRSPCPRGDRDKNRDINWREFC